MEFPWTEIRILSQNWESVTFESWLLQILLSEVLDVPVTLETGSHNDVINFYDPLERMHFSTTTTTTTNSSSNRNFEDLNNIQSLSMVPGEKLESAFMTAVDLGGDCTALTKDEDGMTISYESRSASSSSSYRSCAHFAPEVWGARTDDRILNLVREGVLDPPAALGALGVKGWFIPKYTAEQYPSLTSYVGH